MIGTLIGATPNMTTGVAAAWDSNLPDGIDDHLPEPNVDIVHTSGANAPTIFDYPERPVAGFRAITARVIRRGIPLLPLGPNKLPRMGPGMVRVGGRPQPIHPVQQFVPVNTPDTTPDWYSFMRSDPASAYTP